MTAQNSDYLQVSKLVQVRRVVWLGRLVLGMELNSWGGRRRCPQN